MNLAVDVQVASTAPGLPNETDLQHWVEAVLADYGDDAELVIRIVDEPESADLNETYRHQQGPTNVLSFPFQPPPEIDVPLLGDVIVCAPVVIRQASEQDKEPGAHWAHMVVHGVLHLLGYDHQDDTQAAEMETLETRILAGLGYPDPYREMS